MKKCHNCKYEYQNRIGQPKSCPKCKTRFDYPKKKTFEIEHVDLSD